MDLVSVAKETLAICERGGYASVDLRAAIDRAVKGTVLHRPEELAAMAPPAKPRAPAIEVTTEGTATAARRLAREGETNVCALNFASAVSPGGGFIRGARAQEEDLCRCSALYPTLLTQPAYYEANRASRSNIYTCHTIWSPDVPFFRDEELALVDEPWTVSILTSPAPCLRDAREPRAQIEAALVTRARLVLLAAAAHGHEVLVLGAWGCGAFRNDPNVVADAWNCWLPEFAFRRVVFAVWDRAPEKPNYTVFNERLRR